MEQWEIHDDKGCIRSGNINEILLVWDLTTRELDDLAGEYRGTYTRRRLEKMRHEKILTPRKGSLKLIQVHESYG